MDCPDYEQGLRELESRLRPMEGNAFQAFLILEMRLKENLRDEARYGATDQLRHERARIIDALNGLALVNLDGTTFNDLCRPTRPSFLQKLFGRIREEVPSRLPRLGNGDRYMNRFTIKGFIGRGGFSDAYIAWDQVRDCEVVVKLLATDGQPAFLHRYAEREAKMANRLSSEIPGVVITYEVISFQGGVCLVQENIPGQSLYSRLEERGVIDTAEAVEVTLKLCKTLKHLHQRRIAHCDVKPLNIVICSPGDPTLIDLGAARFFDERFTEEDIVVSIPYSPKELMTGHPIDGRVDIYSLGMTLLHMLSGPPSFEDDTMPLPIALGSVPTEERIKEHVEKCLWEVESEHLRTIIKRAVADQPNDRYSDVGEFRAELTGCLD